MTGNQLNALLLLLCHRNIFVRALIQTMIQMKCMLFVVFVLSIYLSLLFDRHYTLSVKVIALPGKLKVHILQHMNINLKYISFNGQNEHGTSA